MFLVVTRGRKKQRRGVLTFPFPTSAAAASHHHHRIPFRPIAFLSDPSSSSHSFSSSSSSSKIEEDDDLFLPDPPDVVVDTPHQILPSTTSSDPSSFSLPKIVLFPSPSPSSDSPPSHSSADSPPQNPQLATTKPLFISPDPHISSQFYTFNPDSHALMITCLLQNRLATPAQIRTATPRPVLKSWRTVWKDRNEETAYLTAWKRIQDKLTARVDDNRKWWSNSTGEKRNQRRRSRAYRRKP